MKILEKRAIEIALMALDCGYVAIDKNTDMVCTCDDIDCANCMFNNIVCKNENWIEDIKAYFNQEYVEIPMLSDTEYLILTNISKQWEYIIRDKDYNEEHEVIGEALYFFDIEPVRIGKEWALNSNGDYEKTILFNHLFKFATLEDNEAWSIESLIKHYEKEKEKGKQR